MAPRITLLACLALAACATAAPAPSVPTAPAATPRAVSAIEALLRTAGTREAATPQAIEREMGAADLRRAEGAGLLLTYRMPDCALLLVFSADARNQMRLVEASPGPERLGEPRPTLEQCAAAAAARPR